ncbi:DnaT-like ssDNA-binding domain-containing protein [Sphingobium sp. B2]|uniref:DnaT-like ssDNA-binding domain-containing protein n=1 Tax=Sphingobium sp. B2 TaxID=2583228 RepID=UPI0011A09D2C|nr:DnaT-like ssDNA-binding domain-containing protein [Sphingobium sp. B2]
MSVIASALKHMLAAGMPADAIVAAVAEMEASMAVPSDPVAEKRREYDRNRRREERARAKLSTGHPVESADKADIADKTPSPAPSPFLPPNPQPTPAPTHTPAKSAPTRKGTRLPDDWVPDPVIGPTADMVAGWPPGAVARELEKFRNYWIAKPGKDGAKTSWQRTWINWLIQADDRIGRNERSNRHQYQDRGGNQLVGAGLAFEAEHAARSTSWPQ